MYLILSNRKLEIQVVRSCLRKGVTKILIHRACGCAHVPMLCDQGFSFLSTFVSISPHEGQRENCHKKYAWPVVNDDQATEGKKKELVNYTTN